MKSTALALIFLLASRSAPGCSELPLLWGTCLSDHPICVALRVEDPERRVTETQREIRSYLLSPDAAVRENTWRLLFGITQTVDLYPYLDMIEAYAATPGSARGVLETADLIEVRFAPRPQRLRLLGAAVRSGQGTLPRGTKLLRILAILLTAREGLEELEPAVRQYLSAHEPLRLRQRHLHSVPALFELSAGAETLLDAPRVAFARILEMPESKLDERFNDEGFREAFFHLASTVRQELHRLGPESMSISLLRRIAARQLAYRSQSVRPQDAAPFDVRSLERSDWLKQLRRLVGLEWGCS